MWTIWNPTLRSGLAFCVLLSAGGAGAQETSGARSWEVGQQWKLRVTEYNKGWMLALSTPRPNHLKNFPKVDHEYHMTVRVASVEKSGDRTLARLEFIPGTDAPKRFGGNRYTLSIDMDTLRVVEAECTKGERGKFLPWTVRAAGDVHETLFTHVLGFPVDWVIERDDMESAGVQCFVRRRPPEVGAKGRWEQINPTDLDQETPHTYGTEFRRTVRPTEDGEAINVVVFRRGAFQETPRDEVEQLWDPKLGWWRSFTRRRDGHLDLKATLITD